MFDKLIESDTAAVVKPRRGYFMVSTIVVAILFITAVVLSLYAQELDLGVSEFDAALLTPVAPEAPPEPPRSVIPQPQAASSAPTDVPHRQSNTQKTEESPSSVPPISVTQNLQLSRPNMPFIITSGPETNTYGRQGVSGNFQSGSPQGSGSIEPSQSSADGDENSDSPPPPARREEKPKIIRSTSVLNGKARYLPKPIYPPPALAVRAEGEVNVQVTIDEDGNVVSAHAVSGHPLLKQTAEKAALNAKFTPTFLNEQAVKVTGVIVYRFSRN